MSLITACPACQTQFEVTDEQLQAYAGKVRCGECNHVFDAHSHLLQSALPQDEITEPASDAEVYFKVSAEVAQADSPSAAPEQAIYPDVALDEASSPTWKVNVDTAVDPDPAIPAFLRNVSLTDARPVPAASPASQRAFVGLSALLSVLLVLQGIYFMRANLAANYPQTKPLLQAFCKSLHCDVSLPQEIAQLTIDDADIQEHKERQGVLIFSSVLMNHGAIAQTYPKVELTLTNTADEAVLRKILTPAEYLPAAVNLAEGLAPQQEQAVKVLLGVDEKLVTGFRVAIAY